MTVSAKHDKIAKKGLPRKYTMKEMRILDNHRYSISYSEKDGLWHSYLPDENSKYKRRAISNKSRENLEKQIIAYYFERNEFENQLTVDSTIEQVYEKWLIYKRDFTSVKPKTINEYRYEWNRFFRNSEFVSYPIGSIKPIDVIKFFRLVTKDRRHEYKRVSNARSVLNGIFNFSIEEGIMDSNPISNVSFRDFSYKPVESKSTNVFSKEEAHKLLTYLKDINEPYSLAIQLSFYLFIRVGETKAIRWEDVNFEERYVYLHRQITKQRQLKDDLTLSSTTNVESDYMKGYTSHGYRKEHLTDEAIDILNRMKKLNPDGEYVFMKFNRILSTDSFNRNLKKYCKSAGIPYYSSHKIRFYNASVAYNGKNLTELSKYMGHSRTETTLRYLRDIDKNKINCGIFVALGLTTGSKNCS